MPRVYDDGSVRIDSSGVRLAHYYFPFGRPRLVTWAELRGFEVLDMTRWNGRFRGWGTHRPDWWFPLDLHRRGKSRMIVLDVAGVKPVCTPDDVDEAGRQLSARLSA